MTAGPAGAAGAAASIAARGGAKSAAAAAAALRSIHDVAARAATLPGRDGAAFRRVYDVDAGAAPCTVSPRLAEKYALPTTPLPGHGGTAAAARLENVQRVVCVTNTATLDQAWWNPARGSKPQTFKSRVSAADLDTTGGGVRCDFCDWRALTAADAGFGRAALPHAVTGSNLFKYAAPAHGVVLLRHHDPLEFDRPQLSDLLDASWLWFEGAAAAAAAAAADAEDGGGAAAAATAAGGGSGGSDGGTAAAATAVAAALRPFLLWNCLPRAGASQFHGHAQTMLSRTAVPQQTHLARAAAQYAARRDGSSSGSGSSASDSSTDGGEEGACFYSDWLRAHRAVGLLRQVSTLAALGGAGSSGAGLGGNNSNSSSSSLSSSSIGGDAGGPAATWHGHAWAFASLAPRKDCEVIVVGSHLGCPAFQALLHAALRALVDGLGASTFNCAALNVDLAAPHPNAALLEAAARFGDGADGSGEGDEDEFDAAAVARLRAAQRAVAALPVEQLWVPDSFAVAARAPPVVARVVSRGKLDAAASDFGGLEVFGGASIGHTDPYRVADALDAQLAALVR